MMEGSNVIVQLLKKGHTWGNVKGRRLIHETKLHMSYLCGNKNQMCKENDDSSITNPMGERRC